MPTITLVFPHPLPHEEALVRIRRFTGELRARHPEHAGNFSESWEESTGRFEGTVMGFSVSGAMSVEPDAVRITVTYPFLAAPFRGRIEEQVRRTLESLLR